MLRTEERPISVQQLEVIVQGATPKKSPSRLGLWDKDSQQRVGERVLKMFLTSGDLRLGSTITPTEERRGKGSQVVDPDSRLQVHEGRTREMEPSKSLVGALKLDDTSEIDMATELGTDSFPASLDRTVVIGSDPKPKLSNTQTVEPTYVHPNVNVSFPHPDKAKFVDFLLGSAELADESRAIKVDHEIVDDPDDSARETLSLLDIPPRWMVDMESSDSGEESIVALRTRLFKRLTSTLNSLQIKLQPEFALGADQVLVGHPDELGEVNLNDTLSIAALRDKAFPAIKKIIIQAKDALEPILEAGVERAFALDEPVAMTEEELQREKLRLAGQAAALFVAISILSQGSLADHRHRKDKTSPLIAPAKLNVRFDRGKFGYWLAA